MALPKLLQKLFQSDGAGPKLREDIIPIDAALSDTSTNAVQNKIVKAAIQAVADGGYQVGDLRLYAGTDVPDGWFRCDGSTVANMQTNYPKLYAVLGTNVLPNYSGRVPLGTTTEVNQIVSAGLPNVQGVATSVALVGGGSSFSGAFGPSTKSELATNLVANDSLNRWSAIGRLSFSASASNSIYGKSSTVQPPAVKCAFLIRHD